jgi:hypothetical protein
MIERTMSTNDQKLPSKAKPAKVPVRIKDLAPKKDARGGASNPPSGPVPIPFPNAGWR